ncbi:MAG TPA: sulfatase-like hydrolase/transferase [Thermoanaerobaculia bacterium]|nr:sulfatase-like hydrolase/transferase [Thermoanaerobaculia bacterium]
MRTGKARGVAILLGVVLGAAGCRGHATFPKAPVLVISIDTLRADHLPAYGYHDVATPALDALRRDAVLFENAYSHVPLTLPSHVTMLTGQLPPQSGVRDNTGYVLSPDHPTLAERLGRSGYACGAAVSAVVLAKTSRIDRGFDFYDDNVEAAAPGMPLGAIQRSGFETERIAEDWVGAHAGRPFFFFLHLYEPHTPYAPPEPFASTYRERPYDGEIATADAIVAKFLAFLKARNLYDSAVVILMSDHGEGLGDHGEQEHGLLLYRESLHVPLLVKLPGARRAGESVARPVGLVDVFPTVLELVGLETPPGIAGSPLLATAAGPRDKARAIYSETLFPRYHFGWSDLAALTDDRYSYIHGPRAELFDIVADPGEKRDLSPGLPAAFRALRAELLAMPRPRQAPGASDPEQIRKLASLGYIGRASPSEIAENLPDPRDHVAELEEMRAALALYSGRRYAEAAAAFRALLAKNPAMADAWGSLAEAEHKLGRHEASLAALEHQDRLTPGSPHILLSFANQYLELQDLDRARLYAERALAANAPPEANEVLARIALARRDWPEAERQANLALEGHQGRKLPYIVLAQVRKARGDLPGALQMLDEVQAKLQSSGQGEMSNLHYFRADILARMDRTAEAEAEFRKELSIFPDNTSAWTGLALLHASLGQPEAARRDLEDLLRTVPTPRGYAAAAETLRILGDPESARRLEERARLGGGSAGAGQHTAAGPQRG